MAAFCAVWYVPKEIISATKDNRTNGIFYPIVVDLQMSMESIAVDLVPQEQSISNGFADGALGKYFRIFCKQLLFDPIQERSSLLSSEHYNFTFTQQWSSFPEMFFQGVKFAYVLYSITSPDFVVIIVPEAALHVSDFASSNLRLMWAMQ
jgi:hypothetical protein